MKKIMSILCIGCICAFAACNSSSTNTDSVDSAQDVNDSALTDSNSMMNNDSSAMNTATSAGPVSKEDADWATEVANAGMTEVELSKVAQTKATNPRLKGFADMMVADHTQANDQLKQLAAAKNITLPANLSDASQKKLDNLNKKAAGKDFDKAYTDDMLDGHRNAVDKFTKGSKDLKDADLKNFATQTLPKLQMHQDSIKAIAGKK
jgi:putative membrane protein